MKSQVLLWNMVKEYISMRNKMFDLKKPSDAEGYLTTKITHAV